MYNGQTTKDKHPLPVFNLHCILACFHEVLAVVFEFEFRMHVCPVTV